MHLIRSDQLFSARFARIGSTLHAEVLRIALTRDCWLGGMLLAYDLQQRVQKQSFSPGYRLAGWFLKSGPTYFNATITGVKNAVEETKEMIAQRPSTAYSTAKE